MGPFTLNRVMVTLTSGLTCLGLLSAGINCSRTQDAADLSDAARNDADRLTSIHTFQILQGDHCYLTRYAGGIELRRLDNDRTIARFPGTGKKLTAFCATANGELCVSVDQLGNVTVLRERGGEFDVRSICNLGRHSGCCCLSTNGQLAAFGGEDGTVDIRDIQTGRLCFALNCSASHIDNVRFAPNGNELLTVDVTGRMQLWNADTGKRLRDFASAGLRILDVAFTPDGRRLITVGTYGHVGIWNTHSAEPVRKWTTGKHDSIALAISHDGRRFALGTLTGQISLWNAASGAALGKIPAASCAIVELQFGEDDSMLYFSGTHPGPARLRIDSIAQRHASAR